MGLVSSAVAGRLPQAANPFSNPGRYHGNIRNHSEVQYDQDYQILKEKEGELLRYTNSVQSKSQDDAEINEVNQLNHAIRNAMYAAKHIKDIRHDVEVFGHSGKPTTKKWQKHLRDHILNLYGNMLGKTDGNKISTGVTSRTGDRVREIYDEFIEEVYSSTGKEKLDNIEISTMLNLNRAIYLSNCALQEVIRELADTDKPVGFRARPEW
ncbi:MAG: hypothetical protein OXE42_01700 [Gammaproteobacteria bacterium]|nr:hypothetical protein [Gammaproteobacteria bacterium]